MPQSENASLLQILKRIAREERESADLCNILIGTVTSANPLKIRISQKIELDEDFLVLSRNVTDYNTDVSLDVNTDSVSIAHTHGVDFTSQTGGSTNHVHGVNIESQLGGKPDPDHKHTVTGNTSSVDISHTHGVVGVTQSAGGSHSHKVKGRMTVTVHNALKQGEKVLLMMEDGGQTYYVIDRVVV